jgi:hypothetical protein
MRRTIFQYIPGILILFFSVILLFWGFYPPRESQRKIPIPGLGEQIIIWTPKLRAGDGGKIVIELSLLERISHDLLSSSTSENSRNFPHQDTRIGYNNLMVEARLEIVGGLVSPGPELLQTLRSGESLEQTWQITPLEESNLEAEIWVYINVPSEDGEKLLREPVSIQNLSISSRRLLGISGKLARISGIISGVIALLYLVTVKRGYLH